MLDIVLIMILYWFNYKIKESYALFKQENVYHYLCKQGYFNVLDDIWKLTKYIDVLVIFYVPIKIATIVLGVVL